MLSLATMLAVLVSAAMSASLQQLHWRKVVVREGVFDVETSKARLFASIVLFWFAFGALFSTAKKLLMTPTEGVVDSGQIASLDATLWACWTGVLTMMVGRAYLFFNFRVANHRLHLNQSGQRILENFLVFPNIFSTGCLSLSTGEVLLAISSIGSSWTGFMGYLSTTRSLPQILGAEPGSVPVLLLNLTAQELFLCALSGVVAGGLIFCFFRVALKDQQSTVQIQNTAILAFCAGVVVAAFILVAMYFSPASATVATEISNASQNIAQNVTKTSTPSFQEQYDFTAWNTTTQEPALKGWTKWAACAAVFVVVFSALQVAFRRNAHPKLSLEHQNRHGLAKAVGAAYVQILAFLLAGIAEFSFDSWWLGFPVVLAAALALPIAADAPGFVIIGSPCAAAVGYFCRWMNGGDSWVQFRFRLTAISLAFVAFAMVFFCMHKWTSTTVAVVLRRQTVRNAIFTCTREPRPVAHAPDISFLVVKPWIGGMMVATMFVLAIDAPNWYCGSVVAIGTLVASYFTFTMVVFWLGDATKEQGPPAPAMIQAFFVFPVIWRLFFNAMLMLLRIYVGSSLLVQGAVVAGSGSAALLAVAVAERLFCGRLRTSFIVFATLPSILTLLYYGGPHFVLHPPIDDAPGMYYILSFGSVVAGIAIQAAIWVIW
eukprot:INCI7242.9.p1 GENE.INCI7242.9~~INCI7242.9.p1  ORF type:complete len:658 (+),score=83.42 INCI7242.9:215-2188(+)